MLVETIFEYLGISDNLPCRCRMAAVEEYGHTRYDHVRREPIQL